MGAKLTREGHGMRAKAWVYAACFLMMNLLTSGNALSEAVEGVSRDQVVAEVSGKQIFRSDLDSAFERQLGKQKLNLDETQVHTLRRTVLERLVDRELLLGAASQKKLVPTDSELNAFVADIREERGVEAFAAMLAEAELTEAEFRQGLRTDIAIKRFLDSEIFSSLQVSSDEIESSYREKPAQFSTPDEIHVKHILIRVGSDAAPDDVLAAETRASLIAEKARSGADFTQLARDFSEAQNKTNGGDLGFITENQLEPEFSRAAFALKVGEISRPVRTKFGYHIIKVEERRQAMVPDVAAQKAQIRDSLLETKRDSALQSAITRLRGEAKIILYVK